MRVYELSKPSLTVDAWDEIIHGVRLLFVSVPQSPDIHPDPQGRAPRRIGKDCLPTVMAVSVGGTSTTSISAAAGGVMKSATLTVTP